MKYQESFWIIIVTRFDPNIEIQRFMIEKLGWLDAFYQACSSNFPLIFLTYLFYFFCEKSQNSLFLKFIYRLPDVL